MSQKTSKIKKRSLLILGAFALVASLFLLGEKSGIINIADSTPKKEESVNTTNNQIQDENIDFSPATPTDNEDINAAKEEGTLDNNVPDNTQPASIIISRTTKTAEGAIVIKTIVSGVSSGTCKLDAILDNTIQFSRESKVISQGTYYSCDGFVLASSDFSLSGKWQFKVTVEGTDAVANADMEIEI